MMQKITRLFSRDIQPCLAAIALLVLVSSVYWQVGGFGFVNIDDDQYVSDNAPVLRGLTREGISWAFTTFRAANWHPLTWLSHMIDVELFGNDPGWHHRMNVLFHLLDTELLFLLLWRMTGGLWQSAFVAALFGVHPLHVESVAWVAERKDVLSTLFWLMTMGAYLLYVRRPGTVRYLSVVLFFALGLMCKPMLVTLPFVLLLIDWWPLGRLGREGSSRESRWRISGAALIRRTSEKLPLLVLSAMSCIVTYVAQSSGGAMPPSEQVPIGWRISNAVVSYVAYLWKTIWPSPLAVFYPHPAAVDAAIPAWEIVGALLLFGGISFATYRQRHRPYLAVGWLWYLGTLVPVIGLVQVGGQAMADRYTYVPLIGIFIAAAWGVPEALAGWRYRSLTLGSTAVAVVVAFSLAAWGQVKHWKDSPSLFSHALAVTEKNWLAWNNLGLFHLSNGRAREAIPDFMESLRFRPQGANAWNYLGVAYLRLGRPQQSVEYFSESVRRNPDYFEPWFNLGLAYDKIGDREQAITSYREAVRIRPGHAEAWLKLGEAYASAGRIREAMDCYREAVQHKSD